MIKSMILWRRLDQPGYESARLVQNDPGWLLAGTAVFSHENQTCRLGYWINCAAQWLTVSARVKGWIGKKAVELEISTDANRRWFMNGEESTAVAGCLDLDLNFSPSTNLLPIRRLGLVIGQSAEVKAAWLRFPSFTLEPFEQRYHRIDTLTYRYESAGGEFVRVLQVNSAGFITHYPGFWQIEADIK